MSVKVGNKMSKPKRINGGSPQGSILGNYLFCLTTDNLGSSIADQTGGRLLCTPTAIRRNCQRVRPSPVAVVADVGGSNVEALDEDSLSDLSIDMEDSDGDYDFRFFRFKNKLVFDTDDEEEIVPLQQSDIDYLVGIPENWQDRNIRKCIYIDDYNCIEKVRQRDAIFHISQAGRCTESHAIKSQTIFNRLQLEASDIGMVVNDKKTNYCVYLPL